MGPSPGARSGWLEMNIINFIFDGNDWKDVTHLCATLREGQKISFFQIQFEQWQQHLDH
jgi:hypothetical protein